MYRIVGEVRALVGGGTGGSEEPGVRGCAPEAAHVFNSAGSHSSGEHLTHTSDLLAMGGALRADGSAKETRVSHYAVAGKQNPMQSFPLDDSESGF